MKKGAESDAVALGVVAIGEAVVRGVPYRAVSGQVRWAGGWCHAARSDALGTRGLACSMNMGESVRSLKKTSVRFFGPAFCGPAGPPPFPPPPSLMVLEASFLPSTRLPLSAVAFPARALRFAIDRPPADIFANFLAIANSCRRISMSPKRISIAIALLSGNCVLQRSEGAPLRCTPIESAAAPF